MPAGVKGRDAGYTPQAKPQVQSLGTLLLQQDPAARKIILWVKLEVAKLATHLMSKSNGWTAC